MYVPTIHLNGTSRDVLADQCESAARALGVAIDALCDAAPNARDYYPQGEAAFPAARREHDRDIATLREIYERIVSRWEAIQDA